ncbi:MAG: hypothetical protein JNK48_10745 [Bryobacterales bacterium]|nr:hypothetical protein [Bryobacterales bacterium]
MFRCITLGAVAALMVYLLFVWPPIGMANNGDFGRVIWTYGMEAENRDQPGEFYNYVNLRYRFTRERLGFFESFSSEHITILPALLLHLLLGKDGWFDIRMMGFVHAAALFGAYALFLPLIENWPRRRRTLAAIVSIFLFCDLYYLQLCNTFYTDAGAVFYFLLFAAAAARLSLLNTHPRLHTAVAFISGAMFAAAKGQHAPLGVFVIAAFYLLRGRLAAEWRIGASVVAIGMIAALATTPRTYSATAFYNVLFHSILPQSGSATETLDWFGLDRSLARFSGTHTYSANSAMREPELKAAITEKASMRRIAAYYVAHPLTAVENMRRAMHETSEQRVIGFANLPYMPHLRVRWTSHAFSFWSDAKRFTFYRKAWPYFLWCLFSIGAAVVATRRHPLILMLAGASLTALGIGSLADVLDSIRHLTVFTTMGDLMLLIALLAWRPMRKS